MTSAQSLKIFLTQVTAIAQGSHEDADMTINSDKTEVVVFFEQDHLDVRNLTNVLCGSLKCPDFTEIVFILDLLEMLDVNMGDQKRSESQGLNLENIKSGLSISRITSTSPQAAGEQMRW